MLYFSRDRKHVRTTSILELFNKLLSFFPAKIFLFVLDLKIKDRVLNTMILATSRNVSGCFLFYSLGENVIIEQAKFC